MDWSDWALTLGHCVEGNLVHYSNLLRNREALDRFLALLAVSGPGLTPEKFQSNDAQLAFYANAHNAAVVAGVLALSSKIKVPEKLPLGFEHSTAIRVDGQSMSVAALQSKVIALAGKDWRARLMLYQGTVTGPILEKRMYLPDMLDARLNMTARTQLATRGVVRVDHGELKRLYLWDKLFEVRRMFIDQYGRGVPKSDVALVTALLPWGDADQRNYLNSGIGYDVAPMPDDRSVNAVMNQK